MKFVIKVWDTNPPDHFGSVELGYFTGEILSFSFDRAKRFGSKTSAFLAWNDWVTQYPWRGRYSADILKVKEV